MDYTWLKKYPEQKRILDSMNVSNFFNSQLLPEFNIDSRMSKKYAGMYHIEEHRVSFLPVAVKYFAPERFINLLFHEIGHSTSKQTNRWNRLFENTPKRSFDEVEKLEEQIAETIAMILTLTLFNTSKGCNERDFVKYIINNNSVYRLPWEEVSLAVESIVDCSKLDSCKKWTNVLKRFMVNSNITSIKEGVFNGKK